MPKSKDEFEGTCPLSIEGEEFKPEDLVLANVLFNLVVTLSSKDLYSCINALNCTIFIHIVGETFRTEGGVRGVSTAAEPSLSLGFDEDVVLFCPTEPRLKRHE